VRVPSERGETAWHYTTAAKLAAILRSGQLRPATAGVPASERPVVWFSTEPDWEPTACKMAFVPSRGLIRLNRDQTAALGGGLARIGIDAAILVGWPALARRANIHPEIVRELESGGHAQGAHPERWYGYIGTISASDPRLRWEVLSGGVWVAIAETSGAEGSADVRRGGVRNGGVDSRAGMRL